MSLIPWVRTLFAVGFAALGLFLLWGTYELSYLRDGQNAEAVITEIILERASRNSRNARNSRESRESRYVALYSFKEATGADRSGRMQLSDWSTVRVGDHLTVRYVPGIPGRERSGNLAIVIMFVVIGCVIGISIVSAIWLAARQGHIFAVSWRPVLFGAMLGCGGTSLVWLAETMFTVSRPYVYFWWFGTAGGAVIAAIREDFR